MNSMAMLQALVFEPRKAFAAIAERPRVLFPLLLLILATAGIALWYYKVVDLEWMTDRQIRASGFAKSLTEAQIETQVKQASEHPTRVATIAVVASAFAVVIISLITALYDLLAGKITNVQRSFKQWFAFTAWTALPSVLSVIPAGYVLLTATSAQIDQGDLQPLSLNSLFFQRAPGEPGYTLLLSINLLQFLSLYLAAVGVKTWSGRSWLFSIVFSALPFVLIYGCWAYFALGRS
ncbi:MAG: YIP1 family protein [Steroidobacteraceae bacterium]